MDNSYQQIIHQIPKKQKLKQLEKLAKDFQVDTAGVTLDKDFLKAFDIIKTNYPGVLKLFGEVNLKQLSLGYYKFYPLGGDVLQYGKHFGDYIQAHPALAHLRYLKWIAKLDWFWSRKDVQYILLPKGTFHSWGSIFSATNELNIFIDEHFMEKLVIKRSGEDYRIEIA